MARAFCFDLDGTLMDSEVIWVRVVEGFMRGEDSTVSHEEVLRIVYGKSWHDVYTGIHERLRGLKMTFAEMTDLFNVRFHSLASSRTITIAGSVLLLKRLAKDGPVCVVSGSTRDFIGDAVVSLGISGDLQFFLGTEDFHSGKPDPRCYRMAVERLGTPAGECVAFEDSEVGMRSARLAGLYCVALARPGAPVQDSSLAQRVVSDLGLLEPEELLKCRVEEESP